MPWPWGVSWPPRTLLALEKGNEAQRELARLKVTEPAREEQELGFLIIMDWERWRRLLFGSYTWGYGSEDTPSLTISVTSDKSFPLSDSLSPCVK